MQPGERAGSLGAGHLEVNTVNNDGSGSAREGNGSRRSQARGVDDFAPYENIVANLSDLHGIVNCAAARAGDHGVGSAVPVLLCKLTHVRYEFQIATTIRFPEGKSPKASARETNHHRVQFLVSEGVYKSELFCRPWFGEFFRSRRLNGAIRYNSVTDRRCRRRRRCF